MLILCCLKVYFDSGLNTCYGLFHRLGDLLLSAILFLLLLTYFGIYLYKLFKKTGQRKARFLTSFIVIIAYFIAFQSKSTWRNLRLGNTIISASIHPDQLDIGRLELSDEEFYYALYGHIDWACELTGPYKKKGDTLILAGNPFEKTEGILTDKYIITDTTLVPINYADRPMERTQALRIEIRN